VPLLGEPLYHACVGDGIEVLTPVCPWPSLVAITPAAGFVGTPAAALIGLLSGSLSNLATALKVPMRVDDP
jgi:hypothetical protein